MDEGYLALRWNNHNTIFSKILNLLREQEAYTDVSLACGGQFFPAHKFVLSTCSDYFKEMFSKTPSKHPIVFMKDVTPKDLESLLDFMYKGEVHVPQSQLGSLLRTAESLQVKGLAVPDDTSRALAPQPQIPSSPSSTNSTPSPFSNRGRNTVSASIKRKRTADKKNEAPKLTPRPSTISSTRSSKSKHSIGMPELKRIKLDDKERLLFLNKNNNVIDPINNVIDSSDATVGGEASLPSEDGNPSVESSPSDNAGAEAGKAPRLIEVKKENLSHLQAEDDGLKTDEYQESNEVSEAENSQLHDIHLRKPEEENSSPPHSEISTAEMLQVDLSEDGTQFIIGPGGLGEASRGSSGLEEDTSEGPKKPFVCLLCGHTFTRRDNLANHLKTHTGDRPFMCQYCHKCFSRKDYLRQHERIHTGEKPYPCEVCSRAFTRKEGLTDHMRCHSDYKEFECELCGKSFKQKCGLRFHKRNYKH